MRIDQVIGRLSNTSKMPCYSWGLPTWACKTGSKLINKPNSACFKCYASRGFYTFPVVKTANERRLSLWNSMKN